MNRDEQVKTVAISCDHAGFELKEHIKEYLTEKGLTVEDYGPDTAERVDYPDEIHPLAKAVNEGKYKSAIIICGSGNGVAMTANKYPNVRAGVCWSVELAKLARQHNDANILALPARFISKECALECVDAFLSTDFEGGRHLQRVNKIPIPC